MASWGSMTVLTALTCNGAPGDPSTTAVDTTAAPPTGWQGAPVDVTLNATGAAHMEYMIDCGTPQTAAMGATVTMNQEGTHTLSHRAVDGGGLATNWVDETVQVDTTTPTNTTADASGWHNAPVTVTVQGTDATSSIGHVDWTLDGTPGSGSSGGTVNVTGDGTHTLTTSVTDQGGHSSAPRTDTIRLDTVAPTDSTAYPAGWQYTRHHRRPLRRRRRLRRRPRRVEARRRRHGQHRPEPLEHLDPRGHAHARHADRRRRRQRLQLGHALDPGRPHRPAGHDHGAVGLEHHLAVVVTVKGTDSGGAGIQQVQWDVDNGAITGSGANNSTVTIAADGHHTLKTRVTDGSGTWSTWKAQFVDIDTALPVDTTYATPGWQTAPLTVTVTGTDATSGLQHVEYAVDGATPTAVIGTSATVTVSGDGIHTLKTRVFDTAGGVGLEVADRRHRHDGAGQHDDRPAERLDHRLLAGHRQLADGGSGIARMSYHVDGNPDTDISPRRRSA